MDTALTALKGEINRLGFVSEEKLRLLSYFTGKEKLRVDAQSCLDDLTEDDEKCGYLRFLISMPEPQGIPTTEIIKNILRESISKFDNIPDGVPNISIFRFTAPGYRCITNKVDGCTTAKVKVCYHESGYTTTTEVHCPGYRCITTKVDGCTTAKVEVDTLPQRINSQTTTPVFTLKSQRRNFEERKAKETTRKTSLSTEWIHAIVLYDTVKSSNAKTEDISLPLLKSEHAKEVILELANRGEVAFGSTFYQSGLHYLQECQYKPKHCMSSSRERNSTSMKSINTDTISINKKRKIEELEEELIFLDGNENKRLKLPFLTLHEIYSHRIFDALPLIRVLESLVNAISPDQNKRLTISLTRSYSQNHHSLQDKQQVVSRKNVIDGGSPSMLEKDLVEKEHNKCKNIGKHIFLLSPIPESVMMRPIRKMRF
ncbi:5286_t:CDS:2 [Ambispora gerdemannii]|uniref:5286_t:CDS:1 n=1 Tax=Ambispora gerdemannii TaxID=144530 RepID=A0A9N8V1I8_9GLOM|nr:5286_t:CDS:2 [Ambispora gerdemannii]